MCVRKERIFSVYLPTTQTWLNPNIEFIFNTEIVEYDLQAAGYSLIREYQLLHKDQIYQLSQLDKKERNIAIGKLQRDIPGLGKRLSDRFVDVRELFMKENNLDDSRLISVKRDAFFTIGKCYKTHLRDELRFVPKSTYSSYIRFPNNSNIELYYSSEKLDVKGIGEMGLARHRLYLLSMMSKLMKMIESKDSNIKRYWRKLVESYKLNQLEEGYYLEFNNKSQEIDPVFNYIKVIVPLTQIIIQEMVL
jgi:hypothetical protein